MVRETKLYDELEVRLHMMRDPGTQRPSDANIPFQVDPGVSPYDLKQAWKKVALKWHPGMSCH